MIKMKQARKTPDNKNYNKMKCMRIQVTRDLVPNFLTCLQVSFYQIHRYRLLPHQLKPWLHLPDKIHAENIVTSLTLFSWLSLQGSAFESNNKTTIKILKSVKCDNIILWHLLITETHRTVVTNHWSRKTSSRWTFPRCINCNRSCLFHKLEEL